MADAVHMIAGRSFGRRATHCGEELANIATTPRPTPADSSLGGHAATKPRPDLPTVTLNRPVVTMTTVASRYRWEERNLSVLQMYSVQTTLVSQSRDVSPRLVVVTGTVYTTCLHGGLLNKRRNNCHKSVVSDTRDASRQVIPDRFRNLGEINVIEQADINI